MIEGNKSRQNDDSTRNGKRGGGWIPVKYWRGALLVLVGLVAAGALWVAQSVLEPPVECKTVGQAPGQPDETFTFIDNQVIVIGEASRFEPVLGSLDLLLLRECDLNFLDAPLGLGGRARKHLPYLAKATRKLTMRLYYIQSGGSVADVVKAINSAARKSAFHVYAEPNLLAGHSDSVCGNPEHTGGGSPFGGVPGLVTMGQEDAANLFWQQWAFHQIGAGSMQQGAIARAATLHQGEGVLVGVFDTSPFPDPWDRVTTGQVVSGAKTIDTQEVVEWVNPEMDVEPMTLTVSYPWVVNTITATNGISTVDDLRDHGLFVAGLVHAVAPASEIRLIRVLDEIGCGDLFTLNESLMRFIGEVEAERRTLGQVLTRLIGQMGPKRGILSGVVINLSLGVRDNQSLGILAQEEFTGPCTVEDGGDPIVSLCTTLSDASHKGAVIVAAAGNESNGEKVPPQLPAAYESAVAVEAGDHTGVRACFSNVGAVRAPGGNGAAVGGDPCASVVDDCSGDCPEGVISLVLRRPYEERAYRLTQYGYWSGTSFSTPMVSGLAALVLEAEGVQLAAGDVNPTSLSNQDLVVRMIQCGAEATAPRGVINVPATFTECLP